jgi:hypothetical protein
LKQKILEGVDMGNEDGYTKKETNWLGNEKEVHYDNQGTKIGETKFATDWAGNPKQEHFDDRGNKTGETRRGSDWFGNDRAEHFDDRSRKVGYSKDDTTWRGQFIQRHFDDRGREVGVSRREDRGRKVHEGDYFKARTSDSKRDPVATTESSYGYSQGDDYETDQRIAQAQEEVKAETTEEKIRKEFQKLIGSRGSLYIAKHNRGMLERIIARNELWLYTTVIHVPPKYLLKYRCDLCGHEWDEIGVEPFNDTTDCRMGCTVGFSGGPFLIWAYKVIRGLITQKSQFGFGILISQKELD